MKFSNVLVQIHYYSVVGLTGSLMYFGDALHSSCAAFIFHVHSFVFQCMCTTPLASDERTKLDAQRGVMYR